MIELRRWLPMVRYVLLLSFILLLPWHPCDARERGLDAGACLDRAIEKVGAGDHKAAIRRASRAIGENPALPDAYFVRGISEAALGHYADAIRDYTNAVKLKQNYAAAYLNRGQAHGILGDYAG